jgi:phosphoribosylglycinamide formyltransferase 2
MLRTILGLPIPKIELLRAGVSAVILADAEQNSAPTYTGVENALANENVDVRIFGKPTTRKYRRMAVALVNEPVGVRYGRLAH